MATYRALTSSADALMLRYGEICVDDSDNNDNNRTDHFTPCTIAWGNNADRTPLYSTYVCVMYSLSRTYLDVSTLVNCKYVCCLPIPLALVQYILNFGLC